MGDVVIKIGFAKISFSKLMPMESDGGKTFRLVGSTHLGKVVLGSFSLNQLSSSLNSFNYFSNSWDKGS